MDKKELDKYLNIAGRPELKGTFYYENLIARVYLRAAANYVFGKKYWEDTDPADLTFDFCGETIEFSEFTLIHILNRHFAEMTKPYPSGKDYHTEEIIPWVMASQVKGIMIQIDKAALFTKQVATEVNLKYKGKIYQFWASNQKRFIRGIKTPITYKRVQSFYPVSDSTVLAKLRTYKEVEISGELSVFVQ